MVEGAGYCTRVIPPCPELCQTFFRQIQIKQCRVLFQYDTESGKALLAGLELGCQRSSLGEALLLSLGIARVTVVDFGGPVHFAQFKGCDRRFDEWLTRGRG